ncbi:hypothetical protein DFP72DRAFT_871162 [Ephemerocybe angulata]|uniref:Uncharacterized protein n=1 Tax=Ephemerocybe angulata TaxID=980116 RepID=A0A8H6MG53_9AGAR|nr:hypothetical protein DFP72DRAFT_871162 [Tulosesus angulatus]
MNLCLGVAEIQSLICENLDRKSAFAMALTGQVFLEPALNEIWHTVDSFRPLIDCLPDDLWIAKAVPSPTGEDKINTILNVAREPQAEDLRRYLTRYACRIRNFEPIVSAGMKMLSPDALLALQNATDFQPGALSPQLKHFQWISLKSIADGLGDEFARRLSSYVTLFVGKTVDSLNLSYADTSTPLEMSVVRYTLKRLPHLKQLLSLPFHDGTPLPESLVTSVKWDNLEIAVLTDARVRSFRHLASLPRLRELSMLNPETSEIEPHPGNLPRPVSGFVSLQRVTYACDRFSRSSSFTAIGFKFCTPYQLREGLVYVQTYLNPETLTRVQIDECIRAYRPAPQSMEELIETDHPDPIDLQPLHEIEEIPNTWPNLRVLIVLPSVPNSPRLPSIEHTHVASLLRSLPLLFELGLQFDTTQILRDEPNAEPWVSNLHEMSVGASPISSPSRVIDFIKAHLPQLTTLTIPKKSSGAAEATMLERRWEAVHQGWKQIQS